MPRRRAKNLRYALLAIAISMILWGIAHGGRGVEREYDIPVVFDGLPDNLVITDRSASKINVRVRGSRANFRNVAAGEMEYVETVSGGKPGRARYEVDTDRLDMPRGVRVVGLSPAQIDVRFERRGRKNVKVRADVEGEPPEGFRLVDVDVKPPRVWLTGARSRVLRLSEVVTETIDVGGLEATTELEVKLSIAADHVWAEKEEPVTVHIAIEPLEPVEGEASQGAEGERQAG
jgi:YbbR domain-containing protein